MKKNMRRIATMIIPVLAFGLATASGAALPAGTEALILAVHPYLPAPEIITRFTPLADYLARAIGRPVNVRIGSSYAEHIQAIGTDTVDIAYLGPVSYVKMVRQYGRKPLLTRQEVGGQPFLRGVIIVRTDSRLQSLADLKGKRFAFGDPDSTMSHVIPLYVLENAGVPERALAHHDFLGAHENVALAVLAGDYDAGAVKSEVFEAFAPKGLRALSTMPTIADHVFVTNAKLPVDLVNTLRRAFLKLNAPSNEVPDAKAIMTAIHGNIERPGAGERR